MVYLKDLAEQWPWNAHQEDWSDKEIYTHTIDPEDASKVWRVPVYDPMAGFAYTGLCVSVFGKDDTYTMAPKLVLGATKKAMFGLPWDQTMCQNHSWAPIGFPLTNKIIAITEDGLDVLITHPEPCFGKVEFIAQRFEDLLEDEQEISYAFLNHRTDKVEWILDSGNYMYRPNPLYDPVYTRPTKLMPSVLRLLDADRNPWEDVSTIRTHIHIPIPLL